jgi:RNA polymerase sigma-70 factor (ECF subfamily)
LSRVPDVTDSPAVDAEAELLRRAQAGDEAAFGEIVHANYERVFRHVASVVRHEHDARDVCQEIWVTVWRSLKTYRGESKFSTWLHSIATRRAIDHLRKNRRWFSRFLPFLADSENPDATIEPASAAPDPRDQAETRERSERFERAIASLPPKHRAVLAMRELEGLSYEEIAATLRCRPGTVMSRLFNARRMLAQKLEDLPCED